MTVGAVAQGETYTARLASARQVPRPGHWLVWQYSFEVENRKTKVVKTLQFGGDQTVEDPLEWFGIIGERLFVTTASEIDAFSLATQKLEKELAVAAPAPSPDGRRIAYLVLHPRFTANEDSGSIIVVLDLATMAHPYIFPEPARIEEIHNGPDVYPVVIEADPAKAHQVLKLFWAPDGKRLVFFCSHRFPLHPEVGPIYVVVVDAPKVLTATRFVHQPIDPSVYRKPGAPGSADTIHFFVEAVTWLDGHTISVRPRSDFPWVKDPFVLKLPEVSSAASPLPPVHTDSGPRRPVTGMTIETARYRVTLAATKEVQEPSKHPVRHYIFRAEDRASRAVRRLELDRDDGDLLWLGVAGDRLYTAGAPDPVGAGPELATPPAQCPRSTSK